MIPVCEPVFLGNEKKYVMDCLDTGWISSLGKYVGLFEEKFTGYVGTEHGVACCSGTAGLHTALSVLGVGPGDSPFPDAILASLAPMEPTSSKILAASTARLWTAIALKNLPCCKTRTSFKSMTS